VSVFGMVARSGERFIAEAKHLTGVELISLTRKNRDRRPEEISARIGG
jgi:hypothetical protein